MRSFCRYRCGVSAPTPHHGQCPWFRPINEISTRRIPSGGKPKPDPLGPDLYTCVQIIGVADTLTKRPVRLLNMPLTSSGQRVSLPAIIKKMGFRDIFWRSLDSITPMTNIIHRRALIIRHIRRSPKDMVSMTEPKHII